MIKSFMYILPTTPVTFTENQEPFPIYAHVKKTSKFYDFQIEVTSIYVSVNVAFTIMVGRLIKCYLIVFRTMLREMDFELRLVPSEDISLSTNIDCNSESESMFPSKGTSQPWKLISGLPLARIFVT